jgi:hypothetical protein
MKLVDKISVTELLEMSARMYDAIVKADVDINKRLMVVDMDMHFDGEAELLEQGSNQRDLWGINLHPKKYGSDEFIEFDSMINIRPSQDNPSKDVLDETVRQQIIAIVKEVVHE